MKEQSVESQVILGIACELSALVLQELVGNELSTTVGGTPLTRKALYQSTLASVQKSAADKLGSN
jgi:hypothetical protein